MKYFCLLLAFMTLVTSAQDTKAQRPLCRTVQLEPTMYPDQAKNMIFEYTECVTRPGGFRAGDFRPDSFPATFSVRDDTTFTVKYRKDAAESYTSPPITAPAKFACFQALPTRGHGGPWFDCQPR